MTRDHLDRLKAAADPHQVAAALHLRGGRGKRFFCPFCQPDGGKTPDLSIMPTGFKCFKCGKTGDLLQLVQEVAGLDFVGAVRWLEDFTGIRPPAGPRTGRTGGYPSMGSPTLSRPGASSKAAPPPAGPVADPDVLDAFLTACRPVEGTALKWLTEERGVAPEVVATCRLRFCGKEYPDVIAALTDRFGDAALLAAGLLKRSKTGRAGGAFWYYYAQKAGFLVIPYLSGGRPVHLKVRPPVSKAKAERLKLVRFMNTAGAIPCLYNVDILTTRPDRVLVCEGESDTWAALSAGNAAVGTPGANNFKPAWVELFRGLVDADGRSAVFLALDADPAGDRGAAYIADLFLKAGLPVPRRVKLPAGQDLAEFLKGGMTS